jgi:hypothetical protein
MNSEWRLGQDYAHNQDDYFIPATLSTFRSESSAMLLSREGAHTPDNALVSPLSVPAGHSPRTIHDINGLSPLRCTPITQTQIPTKVGNYGLKKLSPMSHNQMCFCNFSDFPLLEEEEFSNDDAEEPNFSWFVGGKPLY